MLCQCCKILESDRTIEIEVLERRMSCNLDWSHWSSRLYGKKARECYTNITSLLLPRLLVEELKVFKVRSQAPWLISVVKIFQKKRIKWHLTSLAECKLYKWRHANHMAFCHTAKAPSLIVWHNWLSTQLWTVSAFLLLQFLWTGLINSKCNIFWIKKRFHTNRKYNVSV